MKKQSAIQLLQSLHDPLLPSDQIDHHLTQLRLALAKVDQELLQRMECHRLEVVRELGRQARFLTETESSLLDRIDNISSNFTDHRDELIHTLLSLEVALRQRHGLPLMKELPFTFESGGRDEELYVSEFDEIAAGDYFLTYFGIVIRSLVGKSTELTTGSDIQDEKIAIAGRHLLLASDWQIFHEARTVWRHGAAEVLPEKKTIDSSDDSLVQAFRISMSRLRAFRTSRSTDLLPKHLVSKGTTVLPCKSFRSAQELTSGYLTSLQFYSENLTEPFHGATLAEWIRGYTIIRELAIEYILENHTIARPDDLLFHASVTDFESMLETRGGIGRNAARIIVKHFTFNSTSKDLLDAPLVPVGGKLVLLPSVAAQIEPAFSIESLLKSIKDHTNHELATIGPGLEKSILKDLKDVGIVCAKVQHRNYDCDVAFVLDDVLFLCECKGKFLATDFHSYALLENYLLLEAVKQHRRTCEYLEQNLQHVRHRLKLAPHWKPMKTERVIITSAKLGRVLSCDGFHITDENTFHAYMTQRRMTVRNGAGAEIFQVPDPLLEGSRSADGFIAFIHNPPVIGLHRQFLKKREVKISVGPIELIVRDQECFGEVLATKD